MTRWRSTPQILRPHKNDVVTKKDGFRSTMTRLRSTPQILRPHKNDIVGKFAEMRLTPSQREVTRLLANSHKGFIPRPSKRPYQGDPNTAHRDLRHRKPMTPSHSGRGILKVHDNGLPMPLYNIINKVVDILEHLKTYPNDEHAKFKLEGEENGIKIASRYFKAGKALPGDWEYERDNANKLLT